MSGSARPRCASLAKSFHCSFQASSSIGPASQRRFWRQRLNPNPANLNSTPPDFANVVLADEINRTTPRTQSALLEAMTRRRSPSTGKRSR